MGVRKQVPFLLLLKEGDNPCFHQEGKIKDWGRSIQVFFMGVFLILHKISMKKEGDYSVRVMCLPIQLKVYMGQMRKTLGRLKVAMMGREG